MPTPCPSPTYPHWQAPESIALDHPRRAEVEDFVATVYRQRFDARLQHFMPELLAFCDVFGHVQAAAGVRSARVHPLFTEQYLPSRVEQCISQAARQPVQREDIVEVGNFAARTSGDARRVIEQVTRTLHAAGFRWVVLVATRQLRNAFDRLHLQTTVLADASPNQLHDDGTEWGRYYHTQPQVLCGDIAAGYAFLCNRDPSQATVAASSAVYAVEAL